MSITKWQAEVRVIRYAVEQVQQSETNWKWHPTTAMIAVLRPILQQGPPSVHLNMSSSCNCLSCIAVPAPPLHSIMGCLGQSKPPAWGQPVCVAKRKERLYLCLQHVSVSSGPILLCAVGSPYRQAVRLAFLLGLSGGCAVSTFNRHPSSVTSTHKLPTWNWVNTKIQLSSWDVSLWLLLRSITMHHAIMHMPQHSSTLSMQAHHHQQNLNGVMDFIVVVKLLYLWELLFDCNIIKHGSRKLHTGKMRT